MLSGDQCFLHVVVPDTHFCEFISDDFVALL